MDKLIDTSLQGEVWKKYGKYTKEVLKDLFVLKTTRSSKLGDIKLQ